MYIMGECPNCGMQEFCQECIEEMKAPINIGSGEDCYVSLMHNLAKPAVEASTPLLLLGYEKA